MLSSVLSLLLVFGACARAAGLKDAPCPFTGTSQGAQLIKQGKLQNFCRNYLRKSDSVVPWQLGKCAILSVQQSCLEAMGVSPQCAPLLFDNYGSFQTPQYGNTTQGAYYVDDKIACCSACYNDPLCGAYEFMPNSLDVNCAVFDVGNYTCPSDPYSAADTFPTFANAGSSPKKDTYEMGPCRA